MSAYGLSLADVIVERQEPFSGEEISRCISLATERLTVLESLAREQLYRQGFADKDISFTKYLNCRYQGTDTVIMTSLDENSELGYEDIFKRNYRREYGFELLGRSILVDDLRVRATGKSNTMKRHANEASIYISSSTSVPTPSEYVSTYFEGGRHDTPVFILSQLSAGDSIIGPAIIIQDVATAVIEPKCRANITSSHDIEIIIEEAEEKRVDCSVDPIYLSIFSHRFMGIAEQMGRTLQRTSISVNIKERLDFSCALFDPKGGLVANAPHLPVHLGAMSEAVRYQVNYWKDDLKEGDVLVSNHPQLAGGSHLPDITVITPIYHNNKIAFFVASRGHHADVGGIAPGSMPPLSKTLEEEGAAIIAFKLVENGVFQEDGITKLLNAPGLLSGNYGTRNISDNLSDLRAQVAANKKGATLMHELVHEYSLEVVQAYMVHIQNCAEQAVRNMLRDFSIKEKMNEVDTVVAEDFLDDGTCIKLSITIDRSNGSALFDFGGTGPEIYGNLNAPPAVTASAIIYCLRCLLPNIEIPLNQGCLTPVEIKIPNNCILNPSTNAAVVGGNVLTSQRVTDVVLKAFKACAASQGCMNNLTFGDATMGYYETIAGGAGAGPTWDGCSAVHTHMTNTRITDPEILERRYPVILRQFSIRTGSGGDGMFTGGDGVVRELEFTRPLTVSILSERRAFQPYGMNGGGPGARGLNLLKFSKDDRTISLGGKNTVNVNSGDTLSIHSPGTATTTTILLILLLLLLKLLLLLLKLLLLGGGGFGPPSIHTDRRVDSKKEEILATHHELYLKQFIKSSGSLNQYSMNQESV